jgi:hypothetical protein
LRACERVSVITPALPSILVFTSPIWSLSSHVEPEKAELHPATA